MALQHMIHNSLVSKLKYKWLILENLMEVKASLEWLSYFGIEVANFFVGSPHFQDIGLEVYLRNFHSPCIVWALNIFRRHGLQAIAYRCVESFWSGFQSPCSLAPYPQQPISIPQPLSTSSLHWAFLQTWFVLLPTIVFPTSLLTPPSPSWAMPFGNTQPARPKQREWRQYVSLHITCRGPVRRWEMKCRLFC